MSTHQKQQIPPGLSIRYTEPDDGKYLKSWLMDPEVSPWFPMCDEVEIDDAVLRWIAFYRYGCSITVLKDGEPCGIATLYLHPYRNLAHQCEFGIVVGTGYRNMGIGSYLMANIIHTAKEKFKIETLHLQANGNNPAVRLYERFGFKEFGRQNLWMKRDNQYVARVFMEKHIS